jgi:glycyl-tRNA synthetase beta chain
VSARDLLFEIGCEELPASFVNGALKAMPTLLAEALGHARLTHGEIVAYGTPRRLAVLAKGVAEATPDLEEEVLGPPKSAAFTADGAPTKAAEGFAKKNGVGVEAVRLVKNEKGEYAAVTRRETGRPARDVLPAILSALPGKIPFQKSMRWGAGEHAFGRPVHWLVALFGSDVIEAHFAGIRSGRTSRGHRFYAPASFEIGSAGEYLDALRRAHVLADEAERRRTMETALEKAAASIGGEVVPDAFLVEENATLVEEPHVIAGRFDPAFLTIPAEVIVAVMRGHQRYFAVKEPGSEALLPRYLLVANTAKNEAVIARGNDGTLVARLKDARFFVDEDRKKTLASRVAKLDGIVFQAKLGTVGEKVKRVGSVAAELSGDRRAEDAAGLAKADLVSLIVGEFPELQGLMGRWYARQEGLDPVVADAIRDHYLPKSATDLVPTEKLAAAIALADRADTLVGCFVIGLVPSGSADPFALRRASIAIARTALEGPLDVHLGQLLAAAYDRYAQQGKPVAPKAEVLAKLDEFVRTRLRGLLSEASAVELVDACLAAWDGGSLRDLRARVRALETLKTSAPDAYASLGTAFKRAYNIAKDVELAAFDPALFAEPAEQALGAAFVEARGRIEEASARGDYEAALKIVASELRGPVDRFFTEVFVMVEDERVRTNRLRLLAALAAGLNRIAHFHLIATA